MEIRHLKLMKVVAECKSLTKAADRLYLSQSALSHQLKEIESYYHTNFFNRIKKEMTLTPSGERLLKTANRILDELERNDNDIQKIINGDSGVLRLSTACYTSYYWISPFLKQYHKQFPKIDISIVAEATRKPLDFLEQGKLDIAIVSGKRESNNIVYQELFSDELMAIVPNKHPLAKLPYLSAEHFRDETVIIYTIIDEESTLLNKILKPAGVYPKKVLRIELTEAIIEMVKAGIGISMLAWWAIEPHILRKEFVAIPIGRYGYRRNWLAATLKQPQPDYIKSFIEMLQVNKTLLQ